MTGLLREYAVKFSGGAVAGLVGIEGGVISGVATSRPPSHQLSALIGRRLPLSGCSILRGLFVRCVGQPESATRVFVEGLLGHKPPTEGTKEKAPPVMQQRRGI